MKIDFSIKLMSLRGEELKDEKGEDWTLERCAISALLHSHRDEQSIAGSEKFERHLLAQKIRKSLTEADVDFTIEETAKIKELIGKMWDVILMGPCWEALEAQASSQKQEA